MTVYGEVTYAFHLPQDYDEMKQFEAENDLSIYRRTEDTIAVRYKYKVNATYPYKSKADRHKMLDDGTLVVSVDDATAVTRVLVEDSKKNGDLYYADRPKGEWIDTGKDKEHLHPLSARWYRCSVCGLETNAKTNYCFDCGADMRGDDNEAD